MSLPDKFFLWPYPDDDLGQAVADISPALEKSGLADWVRCIEGNLPEYIARTCRQWNLSPFWVLTSAERASEALTTPKMAPRNVAAWLGMDNLGVYPQVQRFCEASAWILGKVPSEAWPEAVRSRKQSPRYKLGKVLDIYENTSSEEKGKYLPLSAGDHLQLCLTPYRTILATNERIARQYIPPKYLFY